MGMANLEKGKEKLMPKRILILIFPFLAPLSEATIFYFAVDVSYGEVLYVYSHETRYEYRTISFISNKGIFVTDGMLR